MTFTRVEALECPWTGTLPDMAVAEFATRLRRLRVKAGFTQADLAAEVGLSFQAIQGYEDLKNPTKPRRPNAIKLARAVRWEDVDAALRMLDYEPLDDDERAQPSDPQRERFDELWPYLTDPQRVNLVEFLASMVVRHVPVPKGVTNRGIRLTPGSGEVPDQRDNDDVSSHDGEP